MNPNGTYESEVNRKIDRALATGQPTGEPIVDELASTQPKANPVFQQHLEDTLIERLEARKKPMNNTMVVERKTPRRRFALPATLVAAMLAVLFGGVMFSSMYRAPNMDTAAPNLSPERTAEAVAQIAITSTPIVGQGSEIDPFILSATALMGSATGAILDLTATALPPEATQQIDPFILSATALVATSTQETINLTISPTPTPIDGLFITFTPVEPQVMVITATPIPVIDIVVAVQDIPRGQVITEDMVAVRVFPEEYAPVTVIGEVQAVVGQVASTNIVLEQPILSSMITDELAATTVPDDLVEIVVAVQPISRGQVITENVVALREYLPDEVPVSAVTELEAVIGNIARTDIVRDQPILSGLVAVNLSNLGSDVAGILPPGTRLVSIPVTDVEGMDTEVQPGERVDILTLDPEHWDVVVRDALVVYVGQLPQDGTIPTPQTGSDGTIVSVAVSPQDAVKLVGVIESGESLTIAPAVAQQPVVVARVDIAGGTTLTQDLLTLAYYPADAVPEGAFNAISDAVGFVVETPILRGYPVSSDMQFPATPPPTLIPTTTPDDVAQSLPTVIPTSTPVESGAASTPGSIPTLLPTVTPVGTMLPTVPPPPNTTEVVLPLQVPRSEFDLHNTEFAKRLQPGDRIDVIGLLMFVENEGMEPYLTINTVRDVIVTAVNVPTSITVAGWRDDALKLNFFIESRIPLIYVAGNDYVVTTNVLIATAQPRAGGVPTPTPVVLCHGITANMEGSFLMALPATDASRLATLPLETHLDITLQATGDDGNIWYFATSEINGAFVKGWVRDEDITPQPGSVCPTLPDVESALPATPTPVR